MSRRTLFALALALAVPAWARADDWAGDPGEVRPAGDYDVSVDLNPQPAVGPETFAWPTLAIDTIELSTGSLPSGDTSTDIMIVERLALAAGPKTFMLDRAMTENGMLLVDNVWRRLRPAA